MTRGVVTVADGEAYHACAFVLERMLRHVGCELPLQVWGQPFKALDGRVEWRDPGSGYAVGNVRAGDREIKAVTLLESGFSEALWFDADAYPITDPTPWLDWPELKEVGALLPLFWRRVAPEAWVVTGQKPRDVPGCDTFFIAIDVERRREDLKRVDELGRTWRRLGLKVHGDCHLFQLGLRDELVILPLEPHVHSVVCKKDREALLVHRGCDKMRLKPWPYAIRQNSDEMQRDRTLPLEDVAFGFLGEYAEITGHRGFLPGFPWCCNCHEQVCRCGQGKVG